MGLYGSDAIIQVRLRVRGMEERSGVFDVLAVSERFGHAVGNTLIPLLRILLTSELSLLFWSWVRRWRTCVGLGVMAIVGGNYPSVAALIMNRKPGRKYELEAICPKTSCKEDTRCPTASNLAIGKKKLRHRQDSNLCGMTPIDF